MPNTRVVVIAPSGHSMLRALNELCDVSEISISNQQAELMQLMPAAEVLLVTGVESAAVDLASLWPHAVNLRWVHSLSAGVDRLLFPALVDSEIPLTNARGVFKRSLAEFVLMGILFHTKKVRRLIENQRARKWDRFPVDWADGRILGIVGFGEIGRECARLAKGLGLTIHALQRARPTAQMQTLADRIFEPSQLQQMLATVDFLLCAAPLTAATRHLISDAQFRVMKSNAVVINVGRGPVIDEAALVRALQNKQIAAASLDVFEHEPLPESSPLWEMDNVLISPHCTGPHS